MDLISWQSIEKTDVRRPMQSHVGGEVGEGGRFMRFPPLEIYSENRVTYIVL